MQLVVSKQVNTNIYAFIANIARAALEESRDSSIAKPAKGALADFLRCGCGL